MSTASTARRFVSPPAARVAFRQRSRPGRRGERHQKLRLDRLQKPRQLLPLKERADREGDPRGLAAPDGEMRFGKVRQDEGDRVAALDPEAAKEIAGLGDAPEELAMRPDRRLFERLASAKKVSAGASGAIAAPARSMS